MIRNIALIPLALLQSVLLAAAQVLLKFGLMRMLPFSIWNGAFWKSVFFNWQFAGSGICFGACTLLWFYIVKNFPFSMAYPLISLSYVFGMIAAIIFFKENVDFVKWCGVAAIMIGCYLIAR